MCLGVSHCGLLCLQQPRFLVPTSPSPPALLRVPHNLEQNKEVQYGLHSCALPGEKSDQCSVKRTARTLILFRFKSCCTDAERPRLSVDFSTSACGHVRAYYALLACACSSDGLVSPDDKENDRRKTRDGGGKEFGAVWPKEWHTGAQSCADRERLSRRH